MKFLRKITINSMKLFFDRHDYTYASNYKDCIGITLLLVTACAQGMDTPYTTEFVKCATKKRTNRLPNYASLEFSENTQLSSYRHHSSSDGSISSTSDDQAESALTLNKSTHSNTSTSNDEAGPAPVSSKPANPDTSSDYAESTSTSDESENSISEQEKDIRELVKRLKKGMTTKKCNKALLKAVVENKAQHIPILIAAGATDKEALAGYLKMKSKISKHYRVYAINNTTNNTTANAQDKNFFRSLTPTRRANHRMHYPDYTLTLLSVAILNDNKNSVKELLRCQTSKIEDLSLIQSIKDVASHEILKILIDARANVNELIPGCAKPASYLNETCFKYEKGYLTPLLVATREGDFELAQLLIDAGAKICPQNPNTSPTDPKIAPHANSTTTPHAGSRPTHRYFSCYQHADINDADINIEAEKVPTAIDLSSDFETIFKNGLEENNVRVVKTAIVAGVNVDVQYPDGSTPLLKATQELNGPMVTVLLAGKADVNKQSSNGNTPLLVAVKKGSTDIGGQLLAAKADANVQYADETTLLFEAVRKINEPMIDILLNAKVDVNKQSSNGETALLKAAKKNIDTVQRLLAAKADVDVQYADGSTPLLKAIQEINEPMIDVLLTGKADVNKQYSDGDTALLEATRRGNIDVVKKLLDVNAIVDVPNDRGETPIDIAKKMHNDDMVTTLETAI